MTDAYGAAGVDIDAANRETGAGPVIFDRSILAQHRDPRVLTGIGAFAGCFSLQGYDDPVLVASTDGVGTKVLVAATLGRFNTIGADLVNHCVNDLLCSNAQPLFFLDYLAMGKLDPAAATDVVASIDGACRSAGMVLLGGETAEMPGVYTPPHFDLAGTIVGALERSAMVDVTTVVPGDVIVGLPANGLHTNGYSLARATLRVERGREHVDPASSQTIGDALLTVHPSYLPYVRAMQTAGVHIKSMAHITGGGLIDNVPRALPDHLAARFDARRWTVPSIAQLIVREAHLSTNEAYRTLNMGVGYCCIVTAADGERAVTAARAAIKAQPIAGARADAAIVGEVEPRHSCGPSVIISGE